MTATYFRRFYPVTSPRPSPTSRPTTSSTPRDRYNAFLSRVGTASCRDALVAVQRRILGADRDWFLQRDPPRGERPRMDLAGRRRLREGLRGRGRRRRLRVLAVPTGVAVPPGAPSLSRTGGGLELVRERRVADAVRRPAAPALHPLLPPGDEPARRPRALRGSRRRPAALPGRRRPRHLRARVLQPVPHDARAMPDVDRWVRQRSHRMLFVYGGNDPWSAEPFSCGRTATARDCYRYVVTGGTHGSQVADLPARKRRVATQRLRRWAGVG